MTASEPSWRNRIRARPHLLLVAVLIAAHLVAAFGPGTALGRAFWLIDVGFFLLWQPFVSGEQRLAQASVGIVFALVFVVSWQLGWGWLTIWQAFLAALVGGKVVMARWNRQRWFYALAFAYLVAAMLAWVAPNAVPEHVSAAAPKLPLPELIVGVVLLPVLLLLPRGEERRPAEVQDFLASLLILLLLAVLLLGTIALMALKRLGYYEALVLTLVGAGGLLLLLNWVWSPRPGFAGLGPSLSRYLLRIGLDFDRWLSRQLDLAEREDDPAAFLARSLEGFAALPWVAGGKWTCAGAAGSFGEPARHATALEYQGVALRLYTGYAWTASLVWQANLLLKLSVELFHAKQRDARLRRLEYLQAVHEAGARLTHDTKNLLQSIQTLCFAAEQSPPEDAARLADLIRRQLPALGQRLRSTLDRLQRPRGDDDVRGAVDVWWGELQRRFVQAGVRFAPESLSFSTPVPLGVFESVADNLLANAVYKQLQDSRVEVLVECVRPDDAVIVFSVTDTGAAIEPELAARLLRAPVASPSGFGIGLYQAAAQAEAQGCVLALAENRNGGVRFELRTSLRDAAACPQSA